MNTITIKRAGFMLGTRTEEVFPGYSRRKRTIYTEEATARVISPRLAIYKYDNGSSYHSARWHVIHIPTGLVIADVAYSDIKIVKDSFESSHWTLRGDNTFVLLYDTFQWEMTCLIRYEVIQDDQSV